MEGIEVDASKFAARLREVVADEPKAFAYDIGVSLSALYNYLNGRIPATPVLFRIARRTGKPMEWFLGVDEPLLPKPLSPQMAGAVRPSGSPAHEGHSVNRGSSRALASVVHNTALAREREEY